MRTDYTLAARSGVITTFVIVAIGVMMTLFSPRLSYASDVGHDRLPGTEEAQCFSGGKFTDNSLQAFFTSIANAGQEPPGAFVDDEFKTAAEEFDSSEFNMKSVKALIDPEDSSICAKLNEMHADAIAARQVEVRPAPQHLDEQAYAFDIEYYKTKDHYLAVVGSTPLQSNREDLIIISTGLSSYIVVYDSALNKVGTYNPEGYRID